MKAIRRLPLLLRLLLLLLSLTLLTPRLLTLPSASGNTAAARPTRRFQHLVLEGGGIRAISYAGALQALARRNYYADGAYTFRRIGGTSAGCFVGLLVALDIEPSRLEEFAYSADLLAASVEFDPALLTADGPPRLDDRTPWYDTLRRSFLLLARTSRVLGLWLDQDSPGLSGGRQFVDLLRSRLVPLSRHAAALGDIRTLTFEGLRRVTGHELTCYATRLSDQALIEFGPTVTPQMPVLRALYASMAIPGLFKPLSDGQGGALVDGGLLLNFPISMNDGGDGGGDGSTIDAGTLGLSLAAGPANACRRPHQQQQHRDELAGTAAAADATETDDDGDGDDDDDREGGSDVGDDEFPLHRYDSVSRFLRDLYTTLVARPERYSYAECIANRDRVIYLDSPLDTVQTDVTHELVRLAVDRAFRNTIDALDRPQPIGGGGGNHYNNNHHHDDGDGV